MSLFSLLSTSLKPHSVRVPADRVTRTVLKSQPLLGRGPARHARPGQHRSGNAADMSRQRAGAGSAAPAGHGRDPETQDQPRPPQASPYFPPSLPRWQLPGAGGRSPWRWRWWRAARRCRPAAGAMSACCCRAPAPAPGPAEPTWPRCARRRRGRCFPSPSEGREPPGAPGGRGKAALGNNGRDVREGSWGWASSGWGSNPTSQRLSSSPLRFLQ